MDLEVCQREPSLGGRGKIVCNCKEANMRYHVLIDTHRDPSWRMPSFIELSKAEREYKEAAKLCPVCSNKEGFQEKLLVEVGVGGGGSAGEGVCACAAQYKMDTIALGQES